MRRIEGSPSSFRGLWPWSGEPGRRRGLLPVPGDQAAAEGDALADQNRQFDLGSCLAGQCDVGVGQAGLPACGDVCGQAERTADPLLQGEGVNGALSARGREARFLARDSSR